MTARHALAVTAALSAALLAAIGWAGPAAGDGAVRSPAYQWVTPPADRAADNVVPVPVSIALEVGTTGSEARTLATPDGQLVLRLPEGAVSTRDTTTTAIVAVTPLDPSTLAPLPGGRVASGNAYRIAVTDGEGAPIDTLSEPASVALVAPTPADATFLEQAGRWVRVDTDAAAPTTARLDALGTVVLASPASDDEATNGPAWWLVGVVAAALVLTGGAVAVRRRVGVSDRAPA